MTIEDVAQHLGLSKATVSLALNGSPLVAENTRRRVVEAARQLNYRANYFATRLSKGKSDTIGLYVLGGHGDKRKWTLPSSWMFYNPIIRGVIAQLSAKDYRLHLEVITYEQAAQKDVITKTIQEGSLDGMLFVVQDDLDYGFLAAVEEASFPFVVLNARLPLDISSVRIDNQCGARKVVHHLASLGHRRIGHVSGPVDDLNAIERRVGFNLGLHEVGLHPQGEYIQFGDWQIASGYELTKVLMALEEPPTAIFCANDHMAIGAIQCLRAMGLQVPGDVSVVGFDDTDMAEVISPRLTTVRQPLEEMGHLGAQELLRQIEEDHPSVRHASLEPELIIKESTAART